MQPTLQPDVLQQVAADVATAKAKARHSVFGIAPVVTYAALEIVDEEEEEYEEEKAALAGLAVVEGRAATVASCAACCVVSQRILRHEIAAATQRYKQLLWNRQELSGCCTLTAAVKE